MSLVNNVLIYQVAWAAKSCEGYRKWGLSWPCRDLLIPVGVGWLADGEQGATRVGGCKESALLPPFDHMRDTLPTWSLNGL